MMLESKPLTPPHAIAVKYQRDLYTLIKSMIKDYKSILGIYKEKQHQIAIDASGAWLTTDIQDRLERLGKKWEKKFKEFAQTQSPRIINKILRMSDTQLKSALAGFFSRERLELIGDVVPQPLQQTIKAHIAENVSLITSIQSQYLQRIQGAVTRSITGGGSLKQLTMEIQRYGDMELRRAKLIAVDQTRKVYSNINLRRFEQVGVTKVKWLHTHGGKEARPYHQRKWDGVSGLKDGRPNGLNGYVFSIDNPPVIQEAKGKQPEIRGLPAQLPFCSCIMRAVLDE